MASIENREGKCSRAGCQPVQDNARAAHCTEDSRTRSLRVQDVAPDSNAPAARSTNAARCREAEAARCREDSRMRSLRVQDAEITNILKAI